MKTIIISCLIFVSVLGLVNLSGCSDSDSPSVLDTNTKFITSHGWKLASLVVDNVDQTNLYPGLVLTFNATGYTASNGEPVWPASGTWSFVGTDGLTISRSDGTPISIISISETQLKFSMPWTKTTFGGGRISSISGNHVFTFSAQ